ncbi:hypothetical protein IWZ00DRAFT_13521 [Phyllosticta capitalensis]
MWPVPHAMAPLRPRGPPSSPPHNTSAHHSRCTRPRTQSITQTKNQTLHFPPLRLAHASGSPMPVVHFSFTTCASHRTASEGLVPLNPTPNLRATGASGRGRWRARADGSHLRPKAASYRLRRGSAQKEKRLGADLSSPERASTRIRFNPSKQAHPRTLRRRLRNAMPLDHSSLCARCNKHASSCCPDPDRPPTPLRPINTTSHSSAPLDLARPQTLCPLFIHPLRSGAVLMPPRHKSTTFWSPPVCCSVILDHPCRQSRARLSTHFVYKLSSRINCQQVFD